MESKDDSPGGGPMTVPILIAAVLGLLALASRFRGEDRPEFMGRPSDPCDSPEHLRKLIEAHEEKQRERAATKR